MDSRSSGSTSDPLAFAFVILLFTDSVDAFEHFAFNDRLTDDVVLLSWRSMRRSFKLRTKAAFIPKSNTLRCYGHTRCECIYARYFVLTRSHTPFRTVNGFTLRNIPFSCYYIRALWRCAIWILCCEKHYGWIVGGKFVTYREDHKSAHWKSPQLILTNSNDYAFWDDYCG